MGSSRDGLAMSQKIVVEDEGQPPLTAGLGSLSATAVYVNADFIKRSEHSI
jgi:hypothetical protein